MGMGIRKRVRFGFIALGVVLVVAGISSYMELINLSKSSHKIIDIGSNSVRLSTSLLELMQDHSEVLYQFYVDDDTDKFIASSDVLLKRLDSLTETITQTNNLLLPYTDSIVASKNAYVKSVYALYEDHQKSPYVWYSQFQMDAYWGFVNSIKNYMIVCQDYVVRETALIDEGIYRSVMMVLVSTATMLLILIMFFFFLDVYYLHPVVRLTKSLKLYLNSGVPFVVKVDGHDEVYTLRELILDLMSEKGNKQAKKERLFED